MGCALLPCRFQIEPSPDDAAAVSGGLDAPAFRAGEGFDDVQAVRAVAGLPGTPGSAEVFSLDQDMIWVQLGADGELPASALGVQDRVAGQLGGDENGVVSGWAAGQVRGDRAADMTNLVGPAGKGAGVPGGGGGCSG